MMAEVGMVDVQSFWLLIPLAPLLAIAALLGAVLLKSRMEGLTPWLWLSCLPALLAAIWPLPALDMSYLWPGASWAAPDLLTRGWLGFTALLWAAASLFASASVAGDPHGLRFWVYWLLALSGNLLLIIAQDGLSFYVGFSLMSLAAYGLVVHQGGPKPRRAGRIYLQLAITGELLVFAALVMRTQAAEGSADFALWQTLPLDPTTLGLLLVGFGLKIGFWPLHFWLPLAHPAAPSPASAVLSGAMIEAGLLGLWRTLPIDDPLLQQWAGPLLVLGLASAFYGALLGLISVQAKAVLAYSSISQMGYFLLILGAAWQLPEHRAALALLLVAFAAHHGLAKGALFLATGIHPLPARWWPLLAVPALAIAGLPFTTGGAAKTELKHWLLETDLAHASALLKLASAATTLLLARALLLVRTADRSMAKSHSSVSMVVPWALLSLAPLLLPWLWPDLRELQAKTLVWSTLWELSWPVALALTLAALVLALGWRVPEPLQSWRTPVLSLSVRLKRLLQNPPLPALKLRPDWYWWRARERSWNHFWNRRDVVTSSIWLLCAMVVVALIW